MRSGIWSKKIAAFRELLGDSQSAFGKRLSVSAMTVSRWENGEREPTSRHYIDLGNLSKNSDCWFYWELAGFNKKRVAGSFAPNNGRAAAN